VKRDALKRYALKILNCQLGGGRGNCSGEQLSVVGISYFFKGVPLHTGWRLIPISACPRDRDRLSGLLGSMEFLLAR